MKRDVKFYQDLQKLNDYTYHQKRFKKPEDWVCTDKKIDSKTGLLTEAYKSPTNEIVMVVHGTDITSFKDWESNIQLISKELPNQASSAYEFYKKLVKKYNNVIITLLLNIQII